MQSLYRFISLTFHKHIPIEVNVIKNLANIITLTRLIGAVILLFTAPFSFYFWVLYAYCGISDLLDGITARRLSSQSEWGAKLDSISDFALFFAVSIIVFPVVIIPLWIWVGIIFIALLRVLGYWIGFYKYHTFSSLHTYANKAAGLSLFLLPLLYVLLGVNTAGFLVCLLCGISAGEELYITVQSKNLNRDCKGILFNKK